MAAALDRYGKASILLHWITLALLAGVYACIELRELYPRGSDPREALKTWHFMLGLTVFILLWVRLAARLLGTTPAIVPPIPNWQRAMAVAVEFALYVLMVAMPLLGWLILSAEADAIPFFGLQLPALTAPDKLLAERAEEIHETIGTVGYFLIGLHTAAALFHHYVQRDNTLRRMMIAR
jgi:cytochrome b561